MFHKTPDLDLAGNLHETPEENDIQDDGQFSHAETEQSERSNFSISETASVEKPVKKKRGRPRKKPAEKTEKTSKDKTTEIKTMKDKLIKDLQQEKEQLAEKIVNLNTTLGESIDGEISKEQRVLLNLQLSGMTTYYKALTARIDNLSEE